MKNLAQVPQLDYKNIRKALMLSEIKCNWEYDFIIWKDPEFFLGQNKIIFNELVGEYILDNIPLEQQFEDVALTIVENKGSDLCGEVSINLDTEKYSISCGDKGWMDWDTDRECYVIGAWGDISPFEQLNGYLNIIPLDKVEMIKEDPPKSLVERLLEDKYCRRPN